MIVVAFPKTNKKNRHIVVAKAMSTSRNKHTSMHIMMVEVMFLEQMNKHAMATTLTSRTNNK
jgi:hypothetical protein